MEASQKLEVAWGVARLVVLAWHDVHRPHTAPACHTNQTRTYNVSNLTSTRQSLHQE